MTDTTKEIARIIDLSVGNSWVADDTAMLYCILANIGPAEARLKEIPGFEENKIPAGYVELAKIYYEIVASNLDVMRGFEIVDNGTRQKIKCTDLAAQRITQSIEEYLRKNLPSEEVDAFIAAHPMRKLHSSMDEVRELLEES